MQQIIAAVTRQVLASLGNSPEETPDCQGKPRYLVVGDKSHVPSKLCVDAVLEEMAAYENCKNILRYQRVIITRLDLVQLADIAHGRPGDPVCCAVVQALLNGIEVILLETALVHRQYVGKSSTGLYALLESYVQTVLGFGVKLLPLNRMADPPVLPVKPPKFSAPASVPVQGSVKPHRQRLITESDALSMVAQAQGSVCVEPGTIITPSAQDIFRRAGVVVERTTR